jgi:hypothetical protein
MDLAFGAPNVLNEEHFPVCAGEARREGHAGAYFGTYRGVGRHRTIDFHLEVEDGRLLQ